MRVKKEEKPMLKIIGIGDLLIPSAFIERGTECLKDRFDVSTVDWPLENYEELQHINLLVEQGGAEMVQPEEEMLEKLKDADILITQFYPITKKLIDSCPKLKAVGVLRGGIENVNLEYASEKGIAVFHTPGRNANSVADFTVGMMISECRNIARSHRELKEGNWVRDYANADSVPDLPGKTVGLVGYGNIGRKVAQRLKGFEMTILVHDPYVKEAEGVELVSLEELMRRSDFVSLHSRLTKDTEHMINEGMLSLMKPTAYLINTARSGLVDEKALYNVLKEGKIAGAALDVFDVEPPGKDYPLVTLENVTITPHLAGGSRDAFTQSPVLLSKEMRKALVDHEKTSFLMNADACKDNPLLQGE